MGGQLIRKPHDSTYSPFQKLHGTSCDKESLSCSKEFEINKVVVGTSFRRNDFWDLFDGQALLMIGCLEYHGPIIAAPKLVANSPQGF